MRDSTRVAAIAKKQIKAMAPGAMSKPADAGWQLDATHCPPNEELYGWLEWEFARSNRWACVMVKWLRSRPRRELAEGELPSPSRQPRLIRNLARHAPEFPARAWTEIRPIRRIKLLQLLDLDRWDLHARERVCREADLDIFVNRCVFGEQSTAELKAIAGCHVLLKLNLELSQPQIVRAFKVWLAGFVERLKADPDHKRRIASQSRRNAGRGFNRSEVLAWMNRLVALRLGKYYANDWRRCEALIQGCSFKRLGYADDSSWKRAQIEAADLMNRLEFAWRKDWNCAVESVLNPDRFLHHPFVRMLGRPLPFSRGPRKFRPSIGRLHKGTDTKVKPEAKAKATKRLIDYIGRSVITNS